MTQEEKQLLLVDICARLPYGVKVETRYNLYEGELKNKHKIGENVRDGVFTGFGDLDNIIVSFGDCNWEAFSIDSVKPYLRPMSSMTEEEKQIMGNLWKDNNRLVFADPSEIRRYRFYDISVVDFLNAHHFDYRGLIEKGLAIEAPKGMYNTK